MPTQALAPEQSTNIGVPAGKLLLGDVAIRGDLVASVVLVVAVEGVAVGHHAGLHVLAGLDAVGGTGAGRVGF